MCMNLTFIPSGLTILQPLSTTLSDLNENLELVLVIEISYYLLNTVICFFFVVKNIFVHRKRTKMFYANITLQ